MASGIAKLGGNAFDLALLDIDGATRGDLYQRGVDAWGRLPLGTSGFILLSDGTDAFWAANPGGGDMLAAVYDPTAVVGDAFDLDNFDAPGSLQGALYTKFAGGWSDLAAGVAGQVLTSGGPAADNVWAAPTGDMLASVYDPTAVVGDAFDLALFRITSQAIGDLYVRGVGTWERRAIGANGEVLTVVTGVPAWATPAGDMLASVYDPTAASADAFDFANMSISGATRGDLITRGAATFERLAAAAAGLVLTSNGAAADPTYQSPTTTISSTITHAELSAAGLVQDKLFAVAENVPIGATVTAVEMILEIAFAGGTVSSLLMGMGDTTGNNDLVDTSDELTGGAVPRRIEDAMNNNYLHHGGMFTRDPPASWRPSMRFTAIGDNLVNLTAGSLTVWVAYFFDPNRALSGAGPAPV